MTLQPPHRKDSTTYRKKLIEVALPLNEISEQAARERSTRHWHPSTLHLWWARRLLVACRAVLGNCRAFRLKDHSAFGSE